MSLFSRVFRAGRSSGATTVIAAGTTITGTVRGTGRLIVEGDVQGDIAVDTVVIAEGGSVQGEASADLMHVAGDVRGSVQARHLQIAATGHFSGDALYEELEVAEGARFDARCRAIPVPASHKVPEVEREPVGVPKADPVLPALAGPAVAAGGV